MPEVPTHTVVVLSDLHVPAAEPLHGAVDAEARVRAAFTAVRRAGLRPDVVLVPGDVADAGAAAAYARIGPVLDAEAAALGAELLVLPGNHDDDAGLRTLSAVAGDGPLDRVLEVRGLRVVGLDSTVAGQHHGELGDGQLAWLRDVLATPAAAGTILALHHQPIWSTTTTSHALALRSPERLAAVLAGTDVRLVVCGHVHRVAVGTLAGVPVWVCPSTATAADVLAPAGMFRSLTGGGFSRLDVLAGDVVATYVADPSSARTLRELDVGALLDRAG